MQAKHLSETDSSPPLHAFIASHQAVQGPSLACSTAEATDTYSFLRYFPLMVASQAAQSFLLSRSFSVFLGDASNCFQVARRLTRHRLVSDAFSRCLQWLFFSLRTPYGTNAKQILAVLRQSSLTRYIVRASITVTFCPSIKFQLIFPERSPNSLSFPRDTLNILFCSSMVVLAAGRESRLALNLCP